MLRHSHYNGRAREVIEEAPPIPTSQNQNEAPILVEYTIPHEPSP